MLKRTGDSVDRVDDAPTPVGLLAALLDHDEPVTLLALSRQLAMGVDGVRTEVEQLRAAGCELDEHPQRGVKLIRAALGTWRDYLTAFSCPAATHPLIQIYSRTTSTQDIARRVVIAHGWGAHNALIVADAQTAGRGRLGRRWIAPAGAAVTFSRVRIIDNSAGGAVDQLTFATTVAVARALDVFLSQRGLMCQIKWPNDLYVEERKIAGILVERFVAARDVQAAIIGIGINVGLRPEDLPGDETLREKVTSLGMLGLAVDRLAVLAEVWRQLNRALDQPLDGDLLDEWRRRCTMLHQQVHLLAEGREVRGQVVDLDPHAGLIVRTETGELRHLPAATTTVR